MGWLIFIGILIVMTLLENSISNSSRKNRKSPPPKNVEDIISQLRQKKQQTQNYNKIASKLRARTHRKPLELSTPSEHSSSHKLCEERVRQPTKQEKNLEGPISKKKPLELYSKSNDDILSTTMLAKDLGINGPNLIEHFIDVGLLARDSFNKLQLTSVGKSLGGTYRQKNEAEKWVVWPKSISNTWYVKSIDTTKAKPSSSSTKLSPKLCNSIRHYGTYHPYHNGQNPHFDSFSSQILNFKAGQKEAIQYFFNLLTKKVNFDNTEAILYVPSHDANKTSSPVRELASMLAKHFNWVDATDCLVRAKTIKKLANGGNRDKTVHVNSLKVKSLHLISNKNVLILDDVTTTGGSLYASMELMNEHKIKSIWSYALAKTF